MRRLVEANERSEGELTDERRRRLGCYGLQLTSTYVIHGRESFGYHCGKPSWIMRPSCHVGGWFATAKSMTTSHHPCLILQDSQITFGTICVI